MANWKYMGKRQSDGALVDFGFGQTLPTMKRTVVHGSNFYSRVFSYAGQVGSTWIFDVLQVYEDMRLPTVSNESVNTNAGPVIGNAKAPNTVTYFFNYSTTINAGDTVQHRDITQTAYGTSWNWPYFWDVIGSKTKTLDVSSVFYDANGVGYKIVKANIFTVSATTQSVEGNQVGNIAIYDGNSKLLAGSDSKTSSSGVHKYSAEIISESNPTVKIVATAIVGNTTDKKKAWHQSYFFNGFRHDDVAVNNKSITFTESVATYSTTILDDTSFIVNYGKKYAITVNKSTGVASSTVSYSRTHSTGSYVNTTISPLSLSNSGTLYVEANQTISISATASDGYVFHTNAVTSSASGYGTITGTGTTTLSGSKLCSGATTLTIKGTQYKITPTLGNTAQSSWGTPTINGSSAGVALKPNTTYTLGFTSSTASTYAPVVDYWNIGGDSYTTSFTTGSQILGNLNALLILRQTKWQLTVANGTNATWGNVYIGDSGTATSGWYANGTSVKVRFVSSLADTIAPTANQINYNGETSACSGNSAIITTTSESHTATMYLKQTRWQMGIGYSTSSTSGWGTIAFKRHSDSAWTTSANKLYVGTGDQIDLKFTPAASYASTIHPIVDAWTFLTQNEKPTSASDGSSTITVTLGTVAANFTANASLSSSWRKVTIQRSDSLTAAWGSFYLGDSGTNTTAYYAPGTKIKMRFVRSTAYDLKERPQVGTIAVGTEKTIAGSDGTYAYEYTLPTNTKSDLVISCSVKQTAWPVSVFIDSVSMATLTARRINIASGSIIDSVTNSGSAQTIYLRAGTEFEYLALAYAANGHYKFDKWEKTNLVNYNGNAAYVQLSKSESASVKAIGTRKDFCITGTSDNASVCEVYMQNSAESVAYFDKTVTSNPVVVCKIKSAHKDQYKVASFSIGDQHGIEAQYNPAADVYYVEVANRNDVTVTAHIVQTYFNLSVNVTPGNSSDFGTVVVMAGEQQLAENSYNGRLREGTKVSIVFYEKYGGRVIEILPSEKIKDANQSESAIAFNMPSGDCSVNLTLGAKETYPLTVGVVNLAEGSTDIIPGIVRVASRTYPDIVIGATADDGVVKTFQVYKDEEYTLVASGVDDELSRRYTFVGWRDASGGIEGAYETSLNILNADEDAITRYASYNARANGTITIEYAKKDGETITPISADEVKYLLTITNTADKFDETHWLIGADVNIGYTVDGSAYDENGDAYKWTPVQVDVAIEGEEYRTPNAIWDDGLLTQTGSFRMLGNMSVRLVLTQTVVLGYTVMRLGYRQSTALMGEMSIFSTEMDSHDIDANGATAIVQKGKKAVIMASPRPGFAFAGWFTLSDGVWTAVENATAIHEIDYVTSPMTVYYAQFVASTVSNIKAWNANAAVAKTCEWRSKVYVGSQFFRLSACRVYADAYPVTLKIYMASSPDDIFGSSARTTEVVIQNQNPRRLPLVRPEKYFAFKVSGYARINHVGIASSMEALK